ncbi:hypothetical protein BDF19DRAFT_431742 [Syncephalis fuscata]|nr:hypothetical protein BDF19DRAFT_431742 [Syncephalis fuscata]
MSKSRFESTILILPTIDRDTFICSLETKTLQAIFNVSKAIYTLFCNSNTYWRVIYTRQFEWPYVQNEEEFLLWYRSTYRKETGQEIELPEFSWRDAYRARLRFARCLRKGNIIEQTIYLAHADDEYLQVTARCASGFLVMSRNRMQMRTNHVYLIRIMNLLGSNNLPSNNTISTSSCRSVAVELKPAADIKDFSQMDYHINHSFIVLSHQTALSVWRTQKDELYATYYFEYAVIIRSVQDHWAVLIQVDDQNNIILLDLETGKRQLCRIPEVLDNDHLVANQIPQFIEGTYDDGVSVYCNNSLGINSDVLVWSIYRVHIHSGMISILRQGSCQINQHAFGHSGFKRVGPGIVVWNFRAVDSLRRHMAIHQTNTSGETTLLTFPGANAIYQISSKLLILLFTKQVEIFDINTRQAIMSNAHTRITGPFLPIIGRHWMRYQVARDDNGARSCGKLIELQTVQGMADTHSVWYEPKEGLLDKLSALNQCCVVPSCIMRTTENQEKVILCYFEMK